MNEDYLYNEPFEKDDYDKDNDAYEDAIERLRIEKEEEEQE